MPLSNQEKKEKIKEILNNIHFDALNYQQVNPISEVFKNQNLPKPQNIETLKEHVSKWLIENFSSVQNDIERFVAAKSVQNDQIRSLTLSILYSYRQKVGIELPSNPYINQLPNQPKFSNTPPNLQTLNAPNQVPSNLQPGMLNMPNMPTSMPNMPANMPPNMPNNIPANMPANMPPNIAANISGNVPANNVPVNMPNMPNVPNASGNMQPMPGYMNYPPYNYMHNYMMGGNHNPMMYQAPSHTQQPPPNFQNREYFSMNPNPYYMPMPVGYHPHMYGYPPHSSSSDVNNSYKYPYPASDYNYEGNAGKKAEKKPAPEQRIEPVPQQIQIKKAGKKQSLVASTVDEYEQNYKRYFELHGKKYEDGPFKIIPPSKQNPQTKIQIQAQSSKSSEIQEIPKPVVKVQSKKQMIPQGSYNEEFRFCLCRGYGNFEDFFQCQACKQKFHFFCLKKKQTKEINKICAFCFMKEIDPFNSVIKEIKTNYIYRIAEEKFSEIFNFQSVKEYQEKSKNQNQYEIQLRTMRLQDASNQVIEYTWPDESILTFDDEKIFQFQALQHNSSMKKRKDTSLIVNNNLFGMKKYKLNQIKISIQIKNLTINEYNSKKIKNNHPFIFGVYIIRKNTLDELYNNILNETNNKVNFIRDYFSNSQRNDEQQSEDIKIQQIKVNLQDPYSWTIIQTPVRGSKCNHGQCFDLKTFLGFMNVQKNRNWKCPICAKSCQRFLIDIQQNDILKVFKEKYEEGKENISNVVTFHCDGRTLFKEDKSAEDGENNSNESLKIEKTVGTNKRKQRKEDEEMIEENNEKDDPKKGEVENNVMEE